jgi:hypothetical protein
VSNTAIGYDALKIANAGGSDGGVTTTGNTAIGTQAGNALTTGKFNTFLGAGTDPSANSGENQTAIGFGTTGVADNSVTLGNADTTAVYMAQDSGATVYAANLVVSADISHGSDSDTKIAFGLDSITFTAGNVEMMKFSEGSTDEVVINEGSADVNFRVESNGEANMLFVNGGTNQVSVGSYSITSPFEGDADRDFKHDSPFTVFSTGELGNSDGDTVGMATFGYEGATSNGHYLEFFGVRDTAGTTWESAGTRIQKVIDTTGMGYIEFNGAAGNAGIGFGTGTTSSGCLGIDTLPFASIVIAIVSP